MSLQINIMQGFRAIALHHLPIVCRSSGTSILEYIGKYFKFRIEKKTGDLGVLYARYLSFFAQLPTIFGNITPIKKPSLHRSNGFNYELCIMN